MKVSNYRLTISFTTGLLCLLLSLTSCDNFIPRLIRYNAPGINDWKVFPVTKVAASDKPFFFVERKYHPLPPMQLWLEDKYIKDCTFFEEFLLKTKTSSFMVIRNDTILYENYFHGASINQPQIIFSVTKSITSALAGIAINEGKIKSIDQKVSDFIPEFKVDERDNITIRHLLNMTSGLDFEDRRTVFKLGHAYYTSDIDEYILKVKLAHPPGTYFAYKSIDTQLLGECIAKATGIPIETYLEEKLWKPIGAEYDAFFTLDKEGGSPRVYGGLAACTRDLAKLGKLYMQMGKWGNKQIIPEYWVSQSITRRINKGDNYWGYTNSWWLMSYVDKNIDELTDFYAAGYLGQYIYINPESNIIIVRQGSEDDLMEWQYPMARLSHLLSEGDACKPQFLETEKYTGNFISEDGSELNLEFKNDKWILNDDGKKLELEEECPQSLFNFKKRKRVIYQIEGNEVKGVYLDDLHHLKYFSKQHSQ